VGAGLAIFDAILSLFERRTSAVIGEGLIYDLRAKVFSHIQEMPIAFFSRTQTGALISRLNNDVIGAQQAFTDLFSNVVGNVILVTIVIGTMLVLSWQITLVALLLLPVFLIPARRVGRKLGTLFQRGMELNAEMNMVMTERFNVSGAMLVKLFGRPRDEREFFESRAGQVRDIGIHQAMYQRFFFIALVLDRVIGDGVRLRLRWRRGDSWRTRTRNTRGPDALSGSALRTAYSVVESEHRLHVSHGEFRATLRSARPGTDDQGESRRRRDARRSGGVDLQSRRFFLSRRRRGLTGLVGGVARLDDTPRTDVLHDVSFRVEPGTMTALVGHSGAGKTTISMLVSRLYDVDHGSVTINGVDVRQATTASLNAMVGVVTQDPHLFHDSLRTNLIFARPAASPAEIESALRAAQIWELVQSLPLGLDTVVGERGYRLSGGEKQRVALARLLLKAPRLVVLDEATRISTTRAKRPCSARWTRQCPRARHW